MIKKLVDILKPYKELITIVVFLCASAYAAVTHFATSHQLNEARAALESQQQKNFTVALAALKELKCLTELNRTFLRAETQEFRLSTLLDKNLSRSHAFSGEDSAVAREELEKLRLNRDILAQDLGATASQKNEALFMLQNNSCASET